jgi:hypothetical protein
MYRGAAIPALPTQTDTRHAGAWTRVVEIEMVNGAALGLGCRRLSGKTQSILILILIPILISILLGACRPRGAASQLHFARYLPEPPGMIPTFPTRHSRYCYQAQRVWSHNSSCPNASSKPILAALAELTHAHMLLVLAVCLWALFWASTELWLVDHPWPTNYGTRTEIVVNRSNLCLGMNCLWGSNTPSRPPRDEPCYSSVTGTFVPRPPPRISF